MCLNKNFALKYMHNLIFIAYIQNILKIKNISFYLCTHLCFACNNLKMVWMLFSIAQCEPYICTCFS